MADSEERTNRTDEICRRTTDGPGGFDKSDDNGESGQGRILGEEMAGTLPATVCES